MKNLSLLSMTLVPLMLMGKNTAIETPPNPQPSCFDRGCSALNSLFLFGGNYSRLNFKPNGESSFNGNLGGAQAKYEYRPANAFYGAVEVKWRQGNIHGSAGKRFLLDIDTSESLGYTLEGSRYLFTFYTGFGFRFLGHHLHPSKSNSSTFDGSFFPPFISSATSLRLNYYEFYFPLGFASEYSLSRCFNLGLNFKWMPQAFPTVQIKPLGGTYWKLSHTFANFLVEMPFIFNLTKKCSWILVLNPFYERWQDGHSTAKTSNGTPLGLPGNTYNFYGADLNLIYSF